MTSACFLSKPSVGKAKCWQSQHLQNWLSMCGLCPHMYAWASCIEPFKCMLCIHLPSVCSQETKRPPASWSLGNMHLYAKLHLQAKLASACCQEGKMPSSKWGRSPPRSQGICPLVSGALPHLACAWHASVVGAPLTMCGQGLVCLGLLHRTLFLSVCFAYTY